MPSVRAAAAQQRGTGRFQDLVGDDEPAAGGRQVKRVATVNAHVIIAGLAVRWTLNVWSMSAIVWAWV